MASWRMCARLCLTRSCLSLRQEADHPIVGAQQEVAFGGQQGQAGERAAEVLRAELGGGLGRRLEQGADADLVGHSAGHHLAAVQVEGVDGVRGGLVVMRGLRLQLLPDGQGVVRGGADQDAALHCLDLQDVPFVGRPATQNQARTGVQQHHEARGEAGHNAPATGADSQGADEPRVQPAAQAELMLQAWLPAVHKAQGRVRAGHGDAGVGGGHDGHSGQGHPAV